MVLIPSAGLPGASAECVTGTEKFITGIPAHFFGLTACINPLFSAADQLRTDRCRIRKLKQVAASRV